VVNFHRNFDNPSHKIFRTQLFGPYSWPPPEYLDGDYYFFSLGLHACECNPKNAHDLARHFYFRLFLGYLGFFRGFLKLAGFKSVL